MGIKKILLFLSLSFANTFAANCSPEGQQFYEVAAVQMMWSIRAWVCPNAWSESITAYPQGDWCDSEGGFPYSGSWTIAGMSSEQECWDTTEQIIDQYMYAVWERDNNLHTDNGGDWTYGNTYAGGWFWVVNWGSCSNYVSTSKVKKDEVPSIDGPTNYTLSNGKTLPVDRHVWLDLRNPDAAKL